VHESTDGFESFVAIVEAGSITQAARALSIPRETLSRRLQRLEARLATRLAHRSTRKFVLTPAGQTLYEHARPIVQAAREAEQALRRLDGVPRGRLRITLPPADGDTWLAELLLAYLDRYPEVSIEAEFTARHVDIVAEGFDVALRAGTVQAQNVVARTLHTLSVYAVASKAYLDRRGRPRTPADLAHHDLILGMRAGHVPVKSWTMVDGTEVPVEGRFVVNNRTMVAEAIQRGAGIGLMIEPTLFGELDDSLERVLPHHIRIEARFSVVFAERRYMLPKVRTFIDHVVSWVADHPVLAPPNSACPRSRAGGEDA